MMNVIEGERMAVPVVFIASSSEGIGVVTAVEELLHSKLGGTADVRPWPSTFQLTMAYIESLVGNSEPIHLTV